MKIEGINSLIFSSLHLIISILCIILNLSL
jgi:hypothetical protein